jgi:hypothetical protein
MGVLSVLGGVWKVATSPYLVGLTTYQGYKSRVNSGQNKASAFAQEAFNFIAFTNPTLFNAQVGYMVANHFVNVASWNTKHGTSASAHFGRGITPNNEAVAELRSGLYQSATLAGSNTKMSGHSWAGNEAAIFSKRYG